MSEYNILPNTWDNSQPPHDQHDQSCHICKKKSRTENTLYGKQTCGACFMRFLIKRFLAFSLDSIVYFTGVYFFLGLCVFLFFDSGRFVHGDEVQNTLLNISSFLGFFVFILKDGIKGQSLGKRIFGLQVVDTKTGGPIGFKQSIVRNLVVFVPNAIIFIVKDVLSGHTRGGEGFTCSKVVLKQHGTG